jgi:hypothetical protein
MQPADARFLAVDPAAGHYESFYLKAADPASRRGLWIRSTVHKRPGAVPVGSLWATLFDAGGPYAAKETLPPADLHAGREDGYLRIGESRIGPEGAYGQVDDLASWELTFEGDEPPFPYLPASWMYTAPLPRTKALSLRPAIRVSGRAMVGGHTVTLDGWPGMVGHNWGAEHAERWIWLHGVNFAEDPQAWLDVAIGRIRVGPWLSPWVANGALALEGRRIPLGGLGARGLLVAETAERCRLTLPGAEGLRVEAHIDTPAAAQAGWSYADPDGGEHDVSNCSIAAVALTVRKPETAGRALHTAHGGAYELGMREHDHGVPIAPFADG